MSNIRNIADARLARDLELVFAQVGPVPYSKPTAQELHEYPLGRGYYPSGDPHAAAKSLEHARRQHGKGWLTDAEFNKIQDSCVRVLSL